MKKIINNAGDVVRDMLEGYAVAHPSVELLPEWRVIRRRTIDPDKVALVSGGGSGHEPAHAGYVGKGMLDAAVCGDVFASPSQIQVYRAIRSVAGRKGVLLIIKNYSGDMMNFKNAAALAAEDGIEVDYVRVDDDIAVEDSLYTVGRRGVAGTVFVHKIAGAAAEQGRSLAEVKAVAEEVIANTKSIGFALSSCTVPAKGSPTFDLPEGEMEYGVGIHGEPGIRREPAMDAAPLAARMVGELHDALGSPDPGTRVALLVNGFGATPAMELHLLNKYVTAELRSRSLIIARTFTGNYMTSIDMAGASVSLLKLTGGTEDLLNEPARTPALTVDGPDAYTGPYEFDYGPDADADADYGVETPDVCAHVGDKLTRENVIYLVDAMSSCIIRSEVPFCELDAHAGDGDFGMSIAKGFRRLKQEWKRIAGDESRDIGEFLGACSLVIMEHCGGASGPIWGSAFRAAGKSAEGKQALGVKDVAAMLEAAVLGIQRTGERSFGRGAVVGDKTLMDALIPCAEVWAGAGDGDDIKGLLRAGAAAAVEGAASTRNIVARMGRAGTVGERSLGYPDAGAHALGVIFTEIAGLMK